MIFDSVYPQVLHIELYLLVPLPILVKGMFVVMTVALALYPVSMKQLMDIADSGNIMPPKTTWFEPKLRSGLVIHKLV